MRTESNIKPLVQHEIEALPKVVGRTCTVIFYENIEGPIEKEEGDQVYAYDRYTLETQYRENLEESIEKNREAWLQKAIKAEQEGEEKQLYNFKEEKNMKNINWMKKLTSRKLWTAVASFVSMMIVATGGAENTATQVTAIIMAGASVIAYIIGEGLTDAANVGIEEGQLLEADAIKGEDEQ